MELMSIKNAKEMVEHFKRIYPNDYQDINTKIASMLIDVTYEEKPRYLKLKDFEEIVNNYSDRYEDTTSITIHGYPLLNKYDLEDVNNLNIHAPVGNINI